MQTLLDAAAVIGLFVMACIGCWLAAMCMNGIVAKLQRLRHKHEWITHSFYHELTVATVAGTLHVGKLKLVCKDRVCHAAKLMPASVKDNTDGTGDLMLFNARGKCVHVSKSVKINLIQD